MIGAAGSYGNMSYGAYADYTNPAQAGMFVPAATGEEQLSEAEIKALKRSGAMECSECANRKYQDGSDENDVSFKAPGHISPQASAGMVMSHEQEHVANAYQKAGSGNGQVLQAAVAIHRAICSECGRSYVSGGTTSTMIKYAEDNPYAKEAKQFDAANGAVGANINMVA